MTPTGGLARFKNLCLDARDHQSLATWWCEALGYVRHQPPGAERRPTGWPVPIEDPFGEGPLIWVVPVPEPKTGKNRMHIDVYGRTDELLTHGAALIRGRDGESQWDVMADPEGNEFCVFAPRD